MLAKPEYFSPPDEVCCWPGRSGGAAGRECHGEEDGGTVAESHREDIAGRGAAAESHREDVAGRGRCGGMERSGSLNGRACRSAEDAAMQQMHRRRCNAADVQKTLRCSRCTEAAAMGARKKRRASTDRWHRKSNPAQRLVTPMPAAQEK